MNWLGFLLVVATLLGMPQVRAETGTVSFGIRFLVDNALGSSPARRQATEAALARYVSELNGYYRNSEVVLRAEIVDTTFVHFPSDDVMQLLEEMEQLRGDFVDLFLKADEYGADYTVAISSKLMMKGKRGCGRGIAVNKTIEEISSTRRSLAVIDFACGAHTLAHELGHLMGLNHGVMVDSCQPRVGHTTAIAPYANGYAVGPCDGKPGTGKFGTIMVGGWMREIKGDQKILPMFSNPRIKDPRCGESQVCGDPLIGDEARALNENAHVYAAHEEPDAHTLKYGSAALKACVTQRYWGRNISELEELSCPNAGIDTLDGVERLTALQRIDLSGNDRIPCKALDALAAWFKGPLVRPATCVGKRP